MIVVVICSLTMVKLTVIWKSRATGALRMT